MQDGVGRDLGASHSRERDCYWICSNLVHCVLSATNECDHWRTHIVIRPLHHLQSRKLGTKISRKTIATQRVCEPKSHEARAAYNTKRIRSAITGRSGLVLLRVLLLRIIAQYVAGTRD